MNVFEKLVHVDFWLFFKINSIWTNSLFDAVFPFLRESFLWLPLYLFLLVFILMNFGIKGVYWSLALIITAALCDITSSHIIKEIIIRARPCRNSELMHPVRFLVIYCPMNSGFVSSHAANHFGLAVFIYTTLRPHTSRWICCFYGWAAIIAYSQVYVGVHFPLDIICGALVGCLLGLVTSKIFIRYTGFIS